MGYIQTRLEPVPERRIASEYNTFRGIPSKDYLQRKRRPNSEVNSIISFYR